MIYTLFELTYELALELAIVKEGTATGGTSTTIIDTNDMDEQEHHWRGGTAWILEDSGGESAAPEGEYGIIKTHDESTNTITTRNTLTAAVAANDKYAMAQSNFPLSALIQSVNRAIRDLGTIPITDTTTITTAANQTEYTLPSAASLDLREVYLQTVTTDADDNKWIEMPYGLWDVQITATGTADELIFIYQPDYAYALKLVYMDHHPKLRDYNDKLSETVNWERVIFRSAMYAWKDYRTRTQSNDEYIRENIDYYTALAERADQRYPINKPLKKAKILIVGTGSRVDPPVGTVRLS